MDELIISMRAKPSRRLEIDKSHSRRPGRYIPSHVILYIYRVPRMTTFFCSPTQTSRRRIDRTQDFRGGRGAPVSPPDKSSAYSHLLIIIITDF